MSFKAHFEKELNNEDTQYFIIDTYGGKNVEDFDSEELFEYFSNIDNLVE